MADYIQIIIQGFFNGIGTATGTYIAINHIINKYEKGKEHIEKIAKTLENKEKKE